MPKGWPIMMYPNQKRMLFMLGSTTYIQLVLNNYYAFKFALNGHDGYVNNHQSEGYHVENSEYSCDYVLMSYCWNEEGQEQCERFVNLSPSQREVDMSDEETVDWEIPFTPVLREVWSIPPVIVESSVCKHSEFSPKVEIRVEERIKHYQPQVCCWHAYPQSHYQNLQVLPILNRPDSFPANGEHMLVKELSKNNLKQIVLTSWGGFHQLLQRVS